MSVRRALVATALAPLVGLALAGCQEAEPSPKMPATSAASPTPTESATAEQETPEEFIRRWAEVNEEMQRVGDTSEFRSLSPKCEACLGLADRVDEIYKAKGEIRWDGWKILSIDAYGKPADFDFRVEVRSASTRFRETADAPWSQLDGGRTSQLLRLTPRDRAWVVDEAAELSR